MGKRDERLTYERLREVLGYDQDTGVFVWLASNGRRAIKGAEAGWINKDGYRDIRIDGTAHKAHRLAWLFINGEWPPEHLDHKNTVRHDNRITNLRLANDAQNGQNRSNPLGVTAQRGRYQAQLKVDGDYHYLGLFDTMEEAHDVYLEAKTELHPFWAAS